MALDRFCLVVVAACTTGLSQGAVAQDTYRIALPQGAQGCFVRSYYAGHLARNPRQTVARIALLRGAAELKREAGDGPESLELGLRLSARLKGGRRAGPEGLDCHGRQASEGDHQGREFLQCASVCGRGHVDIVADGEDRLLVRIGGKVEGRFIADSVGLGARCDRDAAVFWLGDAEGDRSFILERAALKECSR